MLSPPLPAVASCEGGITSRLPESGLHVNPEFFEGLTTVQQLGNKKSIVRGENTMETVFGILLITAATGLLNFVFLQVFRAIIDRIIHPAPPTPPLAPGVTRRRPFIGRVLVGLANFMLFWIKLVISVVWFLLWLTSLPMIPVTIWAGLGALTYAIPSKLLRRILGLLWSVVTVIVALIAMSVINYFFGWKLLTESGMQTGPGNIWILFGAIMISWLEFAAISLWGVFSLSIVSMLKFWFSDRFWF